MQPFDAEAVPGAVPGAVGVRAGGEDGVLAGVVAEVVAAGELGSPGVPVPLSEGVVLSGSAEGRGGAESACEPSPLPPQAVSRQETATRKAPNQGQADPCPGPRLLCSTVTTAPLRRRTPL